MPSSTIIESIRLLLLYHGEYVSVCLWRGAKVHSLSLGSSNDVAEANGDAGETRHTLTRINPTVIKLYNVTNFNNISSHIFLHINIRVLRIILQDKLNLCFFF